MVGLLGPVMISVSIFLFFAILAGLLLHKIIGMYIEGALSGFHCLVLVGVCIGVLGFIIMIPSFVVRGMLACLLVAGAALLPVLSDKLAPAVGNRKIDDEQMIQFRRAIAKDPRNLAARTRLAQALRKQGRFDEAIQEISRVLQINPTAEEAYLQRTWVRERDELKSPPITCPTCGQKNDSTRTRCAYCESELSMGREVVKWLKGGALKQVVITTSITMGIIAVVGFGFTMLSLVGRIAISALVLLIVICAEWLYWQKNF